MHTTFLGLFVETAINSSHLVLLKAELGATLNAGEWFWNWLPFLLVIMPLYWKNFSQFSSNSCKLLFFIIFFCHFYFQPIKNISSILWLEVGIAGGSGKLAFQLMMCILIILFFWYWKKERELLVLDHLGNGFPSFKLVLKSRKWVKSTSKGTNIWKISQVKFTHTFRAFLLCRGHWIHFQFNFKSPPPPPSISMLFLHFWR